MSYATIDPFHPAESDASRVVLGWSRARYEFARRYARPDYHIVDAGCGSGFGARILAGYCLRYTGVDLPDVIAAVQKRRRYVYPNTEFLSADLNVGFPPLPRPADLVLAFEVLEHLSQPAVFLSRVRGSMPARSRSAHLLLSTPINPGRTPRQKGDHLHEYSRGELVRLLESAGFEVVRTWSWGAPFGAVARRLTQAGVPVFRGNLSKSRGTLSKISDWLPGLRKLTYIPQEYGPLGDLGVTCMVDCRPR